MDDEAIGKNIARLRGDMSQAALAEHMKAKGWKWSQSTVWSVEKGDRPLRLREASDLAVILQASVNDLLRAPYVLDVVKRINEEIADLRVEHRAMSELVERMILERLSLESLTIPDPPELAPSPEVETARRKAKEALAQYSFGSALSAGVWRYATNGPSEQEAADWVAEHGGLAGFTHHMTGVQVDD